MTSRTDNIQAGVRCIDGGFHRHLCIILWNRLRVGDGVPNEWSREAARRVVVGSAIDLAPHNEQDRYKVVLILYNVAKEKAWPCKNVVRKHLDRANA